MSREVREKSLLASDERITALYWARDERAIELTDEKYGGFMFTIAHNILKDPSDSEECKNDAHLHLWNAIPPNRPKVLKAFIAQITRRVAIDRYRSRSAKSVVPSELTSSIDELEECFSDISGVDEAVLAAELANVINSFLKTLSDREKYIFMARFYMCEPAEVIASAMGTTKSNVYKTLTKIKNKLKICLEKEGWREK